MHFYGNLAALCVNACRHNKACVDSDLKHNRLYRNRQKYVCIHTLPVTLFLSILDDSGVTKAVMSLLFLLTTKQRNLVPLLRDVIQDVHHHLGDIDQVGKVSLCALLGLYDRRGSHQEVGKASYLVAECD